MGNWEIGKFFEDTDFRLWKVNIVTQEKCIEALKGKTLMHVHIVSV